LTFWKLTVLLVTLSGLHAAEAAGEFRVKLLCAQYSTLLPMELLFGIALRSVLTILAHVGNVRW
jgi:hypothetical protein